MYNVLAIINIALVIVLNIVLATLAYEYNTIGFGLNPYAAGALGTFTTLGILTLLGLTGMRR